MKRTILWALLALIGLSAGTATGAGKVPAAGDRLIPMAWPTPTSAQTREYLGLPAGDRFAVTDIAGQLLVLEIFSMYCPHCQREAPAVNRLFAAIQASESLKAKVKMIGVGVGNSTFEINHFRDHYQVRFPLFPDADFVIHQALGEVRTPFFIIATLGPESPGKILWTGLGRMEPLERFIERLERLAAEVSP